MMRTRDERQVHVVGRDASDEGTGEAREKWLGRAERAMPAVKDARIAARPRRRQ